MKETTMNKENAMRRIRFTAADESVIRVMIELPGNKLNPPKFLQFRGKLYQTKGCSLSCNFYREVTDRFQIVESDKDFTQKEFFALDAE
tara:strand:+ start:191 stop:457 length:267 start_codon:yes stop_codon:yes gene_type:complete